MIREIRLYIEGGGGSDSRASLRAGFNAFLRQVREKARDKRIRWNITVCGSKNATFEAYSIAIRSHTDAWIVMLVDSDEPVTSHSALEHLSRCKDNAYRPAIGAKDEDCHLMAQAMEAWLIGDRERLREYYGRDFHDSALPDNPDVESITKDRLEQSMLAATRQTQKGRYHKGRHAPEILERIRPDVVCEHAKKWCKRFFDVLLARIDAM